MARPFGSCVGGSGLSEPPASAEPTLVERVLLLHASLDQHGLRHALGGALALVPRDARRRGGRPGRLGTRTA